MGEIAQVKIVDRRADAISPRQSKARHPEQIRRRSTRAPRVTCTIVRHGTNHMLLLKLEGPQRTCLPALHPLDFQSGYRAGPPRGFATVPSCTAIKIMSLYIPRGRNPVAPVPGWTKGAIHCLTSTLGPHPGMIHKLQMSHWSPRQTICPLLR